MSFDRLAPHYSWMEKLLAGQKLHCCRTTFLSEALAAPSILLAGEGHGRFLEELCHINCQQQITYLDASPAMARAARTRLARARIESERVIFHSGPLLTFQPPQQVACVATHFFLDCFAQDELAAVVKHLTALLCPGGIWILSDFQVPAEGWRSFRARGILALAYRFFRLAAKLPAKRLVAPQPFLRQNGLRLQRRIEFNFGLLYSELWMKP